MDNFEGFLGYGNIIAIHADWPIYPAGIGWEIALKALGNFPIGTKFYEVDDIDKCKLLLNRETDHLANPTDSKLYHVAVWHEDLIELEEKEYVKGVIPKSDYEFSLLRYEDLKKTIGKNLEVDEDDNIIFYIKNDHNQFEKMTFNKPVNTDLDEDEYDILRNWVIIPNYIELTQKGHEALKKISQNLSYTNELENLINPLISIKRYDTAIREASLLLEAKIKTFHNKPELYGQNLIDFHINEIVKNNLDFISAAIKCYRGELRTIFKFIRNDYAHNFKILDKEQCKMILSRINDTIFEFEEVKKVYFLNKH